MPVIYTPSSAISIYYIDLQVVLRRREKKLRYSHAER